MTTPASDTLLVLERYLTVERLLPYRAAAGGGLPDALQLYRWNGRAAAALYETLGSVEVLVRNAMDRQLQAQHRQAGRTGDWWDDPLGVLDPRRRDDVDRARARVRRRPVTHGRVLAELSFGFWRYLLTSRYEATLWTPTLRHAFPHLRPAARDRLYRPLERLHRVRNRIAHHEPVHHLDLAALEDDAVFVVGCVDPGFGVWLRLSSRVRRVRRERPC